MSDIELFDYKTRENWLAHRCEGVGASESAALFGVSPWDTPTSLWAKKRGLRPDLGPPKEHIEWGNLLEPAIATRYEQVTGRRIWQAESPYAVAQHKTIACMRATPDRFVIEAPDHDEPGLCQVKNTNAFTVREWKNGPPDFIRIQVQHEMAVTGLGWASVAVLVGGNRFRYFDMLRNPEFIAELEVQCQLFWGLVERGEQPPPDGEKVTLEAIKWLHPKDNGKEVALPPESATWWSELVAAKKEVESAEMRKRLIEAKIRSAIGDASYGVLPSGRRLSLLTTARVGFTQKVDPTTYRTLRLEKDRMPWLRRGS